MEDIKMDTALDSFGRNKALQIKFNHGGNMITELIHSSHAMKSI